MAQKTKSGEKGVAVMGRGKAMQFKITLNASTPKIWRRILVPANYSFFDLHVAIQGAMGWTDSHLNAFYLEFGAKKKERITIQYPNPEYDDFFGDPPLDEREEKIADYFGTRMKQCIYAYDFGDDWDHTVLFERGVSMKDGVSCPQCIAGKNACPPEDCGGVWGYAELQKVIRNPKNPGHRDMVEWLGLEHPSDFDPTDFNPADAQFEDPKKRLKEYRKGFGF